MKTCCVLAFVCLLGFVSARVSCRARVPGMTTDQWCDQTCNSPGGTCPAALCFCCISTNRYYSSDYCRDHCYSQFPLCPSNRCSCQGTYPGTYSAGNTAFSSWCNSRCVYDPTTCPSWCTKDGPSLAFVEVASGLCAPRGLDGAFGKILIAEAGSGGDGACVTTSLGPSCYAGNGRVSQYDPSTKQMSVLADNLFSTGSSSESSGPASVLRAGGKNLVMFGQGTDAYSAPDLVAAGMPLGAQSGAIYEVTNSGSLTRLADVSVLEHTTDYDGQGVNSNPNSLASISGYSDLLATDSGANTLVRITNGVASVVYTFPNKQRPCLPVGTPGACMSAAVAPFCCGFFGAGDTSPYSTQAVPTSIVQRPNHDEYYVSELTGIFWQNNIASVHKFNAAGEMVEADFLTGFNAIVSMAFDGQDRLFVLEINVFGTSNTLWVVDMATKERTEIPAGDLTSAASILVYNDVLYIGNNVNGNSVDSCVGTLLAAPLR